MRIPAEPARAEIEIKNSKFIALAERAPDRDTVKRRVEELWKLHAEAAHIVWAFIAGKRGDIFGMSDDGEPQGTAGRPVLEVIKGSAIVDLTVMVIRYFGGTKLGTGGLVKAYTEAAQAAIAALPTEERVLRVSFSLTLPYSRYRPSRELLEERGAAIVEESFAEEVTLSGSIPAGEKETLQNKIADITSGASSMRITGDEHYGKV
ncbi:MAG: IMPACT family protein [Spirochaetaceae bacterium]